MPRLNLWTLDPYDVVEDLIMFDLENGSRQPDGRWQAAVLQQPGDAPAGFELVIVDRGVAIEGRPNLLADAWDLRVYAVPATSSASTVRFALGLVRADPDSPYLGQRLTANSERLPARLSALAVDVHARQQFPTLFAATPGLSRIDVFQADEDTEHVELHGLWHDYRFHLFLDRFNGAELTICTDDVPPFQSMWRSRVDPCPLIDDIAKSGRALSDSDLHELFVRLAGEIHATQFEYVFTPVGSSAWDEVTLSHWWPATADTAEQAYLRACEDLAQFLQQHPDEAPFTLNPVPAAFDTRVFPDVAPDFAVAVAVNG